MALLAPAAAPNLASPPVVIAKSVPELLAEQAGLSPEGTAILQQHWSRGLAEAARLMTADPDRTAEAQFVRALSRPGDNRTEAERFASRARLYKERFEAARQQRLIALFSALSDEDRAHLAAYRQQYPGRSGRYSKASCTTHLSPLRAGQQT